MIPMKYILRAITYEIFVKLIIMNLSTNLIGWFNNNKKGDSLAHYL